MKPLLVRSSGVGIVPYQRNYLINPQHPAFGELDIAGPNAFEIDPRLMPGNR